NCSMRASVHGASPTRRLALTSIPRLDAPRLAARAGARRNDARSTHAPVGLCRPRRGAPYRRGRAPHHAARGARSGDGCDRAADHRRELGRCRQHVVGRHRQSSVRDRGDAALRQALRHSRPPRHDADRHRHLCRWLARLRAGALHADAHSRPRPAGAGRRRSDAAVASPRDRPRYQAYTSSTFIVSTVGGPILAGFIAEHLHWSWIFWFNLPLCGLAFLLTHTVLQRLPRHDRRHELDLLGAVLMVGAAIALLLALTWGGRRYGWASPQILTLFVASLTLWTLFAWRVI